MSPMLELTKADRRGIRAALDALGWMSDHDRQHARDLPCEVCQAAVGEFCVGGGVHQARWFATRAAWPEPGE